MVLVIAALAVVSASVAPGLTWADTISSPDPDPDQGRNPALVLDVAGNPVVASFSHDPGGPLALLRCDDPACLGAGEVVTIVDADVGEQDRFVSVAVDADDNPVLVYGARQAVWVLACDDPFCADGNDVPVRLDDGFDPSMVLDEGGRPVIAYARSSSPGPGQFGVAVVRCSERDCAGEDPQVEVIDTISGSFGTSIALGSDGHPVVAYADPDGELGVTRCNDPVCAGGDETASRFDADGTGTYFPQLRLDDQDRPVVLFTSGSPTLYLLWCGDVACAGDGAQPVAPFPPMALAGGLAIGTEGSPAVLYTDEGPSSTSISETRLRRCAETDCGDQSRDQLVEPGRTWSLALEIDGANNPIGAYGLFPARGDPSEPSGLRILRCDDPACDPDNDDDGVVDEDDAFPNDPDESVDTDGDGIGNNADPDDDGDGQLDGDELACGSDPLDPASTSPDVDGDGTPDCLETPVTTVPPASSPPSTQPPTTLPATGSTSVGGLSALAVVLIASGLTLVLFVRRRQPPTDARR